jgi:hypothetical protein
MHDWVVSLVKRMAFCENFFARTKGISSREDWRIQLRFDGHITLLLLDRIKITYFEKSPNGLIIRNYRFQSRHLERKHKQSLNHHLDCDKKVNQNGMVISGIDLVWPNPMFYQLFYIFQCGLITNSGQQTLPIYSVNFLGYRNDEFWKFSDLTVPIKSQIGVSPILIWRLQTIAE